MSDRATVICPQHDELAEKAVLRAAMVHGKVDLLREVRDALHLDRHKTIAGSIIAVADSGRAPGVAAVRAGAVVDFPPVEGQADGRGAGVREKDRHLVSPDLLGAGISGPRGPASDRRGHLVEPWEGRRGLDRLEAPWTNTSCLRTVGREAWRP